MPKAPPLLLATLALAWLASTTPAHAADEASVLADATRMLNQMARDPDTGVPLELLRRSEGVILVPNMLNASFVVGAKFGRGVFLVRDSKGRWGNPVFIDVAGGSFGLQAGAQATELLMVIRKQDTVSRLLAGKGKITLGVDAGVAAGPSGTAARGRHRHRAPGRDPQLRQEPRPLRRRLARRARVWVDKSSNGLYYENFAATTYQVIEGDTVSVPIDAAKLKATLSALIDPPAEDDADAPVDRKVSRSSRTKRATDDPDAMPTNRTAARKRRPADDPDDDPPPKVARRKSTPPPDDSDPAPSRPSTRRARPGNDDGEPVDDDPPPKPKRRTPAPSSTPTNPDDAPGTPGGA